MPFQSFCKELRKCVRMSPPPLFCHFFPQEEPRSGLQPSPSSSTISKELLTRWNTYVTSPFYTCYTRDNKPWEPIKSLRTWKTHVAKPELCKIWAYQRSKGYSGFLMLQKDCFCCCFSGTYCFCFDCFFLVFSQNPTEKAWRITLSRR